MAKPTTTSVYIQHARDLLQSIHNKALSSEERQRITIELCSIICKEAKNIFFNLTDKETCCFIKLLHTEQGKAFTIALIDQCTRPQSKKRKLNQALFTFFQYGIPKDLPLLYRMKFFLIKTFGPVFINFFTNVLDKTIEKVLQRSVQIADPQKIHQMIRKKTAEDLNVSIAYLNKAIVGYEEIKKNLHRYYQDLAHPDITCIAIKLSRILPRRNGLAFMQQKDFCKEQLRKIYREALKYPLQDKDKSNTTKTVMLEMENYRFYNFTLAVFQEVLEEEEFFSVSAGIMLPSYIPESYTHLKKLTTWAKKRREKGALPIKICIVKGGYLGREKVISSKKNWPQAPYPTKIETDANFKKMLHFSLTKENILSVRIGIATHNAFDLSYALILAAENDIEDFIVIEMLENRLVQYRRVFQQLTKNKIIVCCPLASPEEKQEIVSYHIQKFDDMRNTDAFLANAYDIADNANKQHEQELLFIDSCSQMASLSHTSRRIQNRYNIEIETTKLYFDNEPTTDFTIFKNQQWAKEIIKKWYDISIDPIPLVIGKQQIHTEEKEKGYDPSRYKKEVYTYSVAQETAINQSVDISYHAFQKWQDTSLKERQEFMIKLANIFRQKKSDFIGALILDGGKILYEADQEITEAIDAIEYYLNRSKRLKELNDIEWKAKGVILIASSRNFPCSIPTSTIAAALLTGNTVIFKPAPETVFIGYLVAQAFWEAGIPQDILQFTPCHENSLSIFLKNPRISCVYTKCRYNNAHRFRCLAPDMVLEATIPGKNAIIITAMADRDLAIRDLVISAFAHAGQKYSSTALSIISEELFYDPLFKEKLRDTTASLVTGSAWDLITEIPPLIRPIPEKTINKIFTLEPGEEWLIKPKQDSQNPHLWSAGIKWGCKRRGYTDENILFLPLLSVHVTNGLQKAIQIVNQTEKNLVSGLHSLDPREHFLWLNKIKAGSYFINQKITDSIVRREPFGSAPKCSFGLAYKEGGPNFLYTFLQPHQTKLPKEKLLINAKVNAFISFLEKIDLSAEQLGLWYASVANYAYWWNRLKNKKDPSKILGQDNFFGYEIRNNFVLRIYPDDIPFDILRICVGALTCDSALSISWDSQKIKDFPWHQLAKYFRIIDETEEKFIENIKEGKIKYLQLLTKPYKELAKVTAQNDCNVFYEPILANGRIALLRYLKEITISYNYHRYGHLGLRELELRKPLK